MRELTDCSGPWAGQWIQGEVRGTMRMRLAFDGVRISGNGADGDGPFTLRGRYLPDDRFVSLDKAYEALLVRYRGEWDGQIVSGVSTITSPGFFDTGAFEIWPEDEEASLRVGRLETSALPMPNDSRDFANSALTEGRLIV